MPFFIFSTGMIFPGQPRYLLLPVPIRQPADQESPAPGTVAGTDCGHAAYVTFKIFSLNKD